MYTIQGLANLKKKRYSNQSNQVSPERVERNAKGSYNLGTGESQVQFPASPQPAEKTTLPEGSTEVAIQMTAF